MCRVTRRRLGLKKGGEWYGFSGTALNHAVSTSQYSTDR